jgi:hypothetical protein
VRHEIVQLADGWAGTDLTVQRIADLVHQSLLHPIVVTTARSLVRDLPDRDNDAEIAAVSRFVRSRIRYTNEGVETLTAPWLMLEEIQKHGRYAADCDEAVLLWASLLRALGLRVRADVISQRQDQIANHIYAEVFSKTHGWIADDTIVRHKPLGWQATKGVTAKKLYDLSGPFEEDVHMQHVKKPFRPGGTRRVDSAFFPPRQGWWARHVNQPAPAWKTNVGVDLAVEDGQVGANILEAAQAAYTNVSGGASSLMSKLGLGPDPSGKAAPAAAAPKAGGSSSMTTYVLLGGAALAAFFILPKFLGKR